MAHSTVPTKNPGDLLGATDWNAYVRDNDAFNFNGKAAQMVCYVGSADITTTGATWTDVDSTNVTITANISTGRVRVWASFWGAASNTGGASAQYDVSIDGTRVGGAAGLASIPQNGNVQVAFTGLALSVSAGSHVFRLQHRNTNAGGTSTVKNTTNEPITFGIEEI